MVPSSRKRVEAQLDVALAELLVDLGAVDLLAALVVDDLDPLPLLHVVGDDLADDAVVEGEVVDLDREVLEEVRAHSVLKSPSMVCSIMSL
jgi:hypothetical protein